MSSAGSSWPRILLSKDDRLKIASRPPVEAMPARSHWVERLQQTARIICPRLRLPSWQLWPFRPEDVWRPLQHQTVLPSSALQVQVFDPLQLSFISGAMESYFDQWVVFDIALASLVPSPSLLSKPPILVKWPIALAWVVSSSREDRPSEGPPEFLRVLQRIKSTWAHSIRPNFSSRVLSSK